MSEDLQWFKIQCIYPLTTSLFSGENEDEEDETLKRIRLESMESDGYGRAFAYLNLGEDSITNLIPGCFIPKGKSNKVYFTEIVLASGRIVFASGKPDGIYEKLNEYVSVLPKPEVKD